MVYALAFRASLVLLCSLHASQRPTFIPFDASKPSYPLSVQVVNNLARGVVEPALSKVKSLRFATEAAITILRIDDFIKISPPQQQGR